MSRRIMPVGLPRVRVKEYQYIDRLITVDLSLIGQTPDWREAIIHDVSVFRGEIVLKANTTDGRTRFTCPAGSPTWSFL